MEKQQTIMMPHHTTKKMLALQFLYEFYQKIKDELTGKTYIVTAKFYYDLSENINGFHPMYSTTPDVEDGGDFLLEMTGQYFNPLDRPESAANHRKAVKKVTNKLRLN